MADILESLTTSENAIQLEDAKSKAGNDMLKVMQYVYPIVVNAHLDIIKKYGLPEGRKGKQKSIAFFIKQNIIRIAIISK